MPYTTISLERDVKDWLSELKVVNRMTYTEVLRCLRIVVEENIRDLKTQMAHHYVSKFNPR